MNSRAVVHRLLSRATHGLLRITDPDGSVAIFGSPSASDLEAKSPPQSGPWSPRLSPDKSAHHPGQVAELSVLEPGFYRHLLRQGEIGLGDTFLDEGWTTPDLFATLSWFVRNSGEFTRPRTRWAQPLASFLLRGRERLLHLRNKNTLSGSRRNIEAHYDLGNGFYEKFLDPSMAYSSAYFQHDGMSLAQAQEEKMDRMCRKLDLQRTDRVLEIGCGWGSLAIHIARHYGSKVTAITLSPSQLEYARDRVVQAGLQDQIKIELMDYRRVQGQFDKIVSIEMLEAVGEKFLPQFFVDCDRLLSPEGLIGIQTILGSDQRYRHYRKNSDWIRKHIFPGSHLPTIKSLARAKGDSLDLDISHFESFGDHYAKTLRLWLAAFEKSWPDIAKMGFDERFQRKWRYYLDYCAAGFAHRHINVAQIVWGRAQSPACVFESERSVCPTKLEVKELLFA